MTSILEVCRAFGIKLDAHGFAPCPFHNEKTPSFRVYPGTPGKYCTGTYCCFGCGAGGDAINLYARLKNISNAEAFKEAAQDDVRPTKAQKWQMGQREAFVQKMEGVRNKTLGDFAASRKAVRHAAGQVSNLDDIPDAFWGLVGAHAADEIRLDLCDSLDDVQLWKWCKLWGS
jgi:hypothetical protein